MSRRLSPWRQRYWCFQRHDDLYNLLMEAAEYYGEARAGGKTIQSSRLAVDIIILKLIRNSEL
jgi:hypothetical protein